MQVCQAFGNGHLRWALKASLHKVSISHSYRLYDGTLVTCRSAGAWPLANTPELAVQVTQRIAADGVTTAIEQVTIIIRAQSSCASPRAVLVARVGPDGNAMFELQNFAGNSNVRIR